MIVGIPNVGKSSLINRLAGGKRARVELGAGELGRFFARAGELAPAVAERLKSLGFESVSVDLNGYSMGNMNR